MGKTATGETKYKGVRLRKWGKYVSEIRLPNSRERIWLGSYDTAQKAARAFDAAQFCLRGLDAKFNFPDDPPRIDGGGQGRLPPAEIQSLAQQYGNSYAAGSGGPPARELVALEDHTSNSEGVGRRMGSNDDWSFLDMLDDNNNNNNSSYNHDFGLFHEPGDMCMPPHYHDSHLDEDINTTSSSYNYDHGNGQSFLWNF